METYDLVPAGFYQLMLCIAENRLRKELRQETENACAAIALDTININVLKLMSTILSPSCNGKIQR